MAIITGTNAHEKLYGTSDADQINGLDGKDEIFAGAGNDSITGGLFNDVIDGGDGIDTVYYSGNRSSYFVTQDFQGNFYVSTRNTNNTGVDFGEGTDRLVRVEKVSFNGVVYDIASLVQASRQYGEATDDLIVAPAKFGGSILLGLDGNDTLVGSNTSRDRLFGGDGNDSLVGGDGLSDFLDGGTGVDTMQGGKGVTRYYVDNTDDVVIETGGKTPVNINNKASDIIYTTASFTITADVEILDLLGSEDLSGWGNSENNLLKGNYGDNRLEGRGGNDTLRGRDGDDTLAGGDGDDFLEGQNGDDRIEGGAGGDILYGADGADTLVGGADSDEYLDVTAEDTIIEDADGGYDVVHYNGSYDLPDNVEAAHINGSGRGNATNNYISGGTLNGTLWGFDGNDYLKGAGTLDGGAGDDKLEGAAI